MSIDVEDWDDEKAHELYLTACNSGSSRERSNAIHDLGKLARNGSSNAAYALRLITRSSGSSSDGELAAKELSKK
jgi:hypothetical protein